MSTVRPATYEVTHWDIIQIMPCAGAFTVMFKGEPDDFEAAVIAWALVRQVVERRSERTHEVVHTETFRPTVEALILGGDEAALDLAVDSSNYAGVRAGPPAPHADVARGTPTP